MAGRIGMQVCFSGIFAISRKFIGNIFHPLSVNYCSAQNSRGIAKGGPEMKEPSHVNDGWSAQHAVV